MTKGLIGSTVFAFFASVNGQASAEHAVVPGSASPQQFVFPLPARDSKILSVDTASGPLELESATFLSHGRIDAPAVVIAYISQSAWVFPDIPEALNPLVTAGKLRIIVLDKYIPTVFSAAQPCFKSDEARWQYFVPFGFLSSVIGGATSADLINTVIARSPGGESGRSTLACVRTALSHYDRRVAATGTANLRLNPAIERTPLRSKHGPLFLLGRSDPADVLKINVVEELVPPGDFGGNRQSTRSFAAELVMKAAALAEQP